MHCYHFLIITLSSTLLFIIVFVIVIAIMAYLMLLLAIQLIVSCYLLISHVLCLLIVILYLLIAVEIVIAIILLKLSAHFRSFLALSPPYHQLSIPYCFKYALHSFIFHHIPLFSQYYLITDLFIPLLLFMYDCPIPQIIHYSMIITQNFPLLYSYSQSSMSYYLCFVMF